MSLTTDLLDAIGAGISLTRDGGSSVPAGQPVHVRVISPDLSNLTVPALMPGDVTLSWLAKSVRFNDPLPAPIGVDGMGNPKSLADSLKDYLVAANVIGGTPIAGVQVPVEGPPLKGAIPPTTAIGIGISTIAGSVTPPNVVANPVPVPSSPATLPGVPPQAPNTPAAGDVLSGIPGLLGQVAGSIPVLVNAPVTLSVTWQVMNGSTVLAEGTGYLAPQGMSGANIELIFAPVFKELGQEGTSTLTIVATVTLHALTESVTLPPLSLSVVVPDIGIPRVFVGFRHTNFAPQDSGDSGFAFVMVPGSYPFRTFDQLSPVLTSLQTTLANLHSFVGIAGFLTGLGQLVDAVPTQPSLQFRAADQIGDLEDVVFESHWYGDYDADEEISSALFIGVPGSQFEIFNEDDFDDSDGQITLTTGSQMWAALTSFVFTDQSQAEGFAQPESSVVTISKTIRDNYNDEAESVRFA
jgi:hypothetical protein